MVQTPNIGHRKEIFLAPRSRVPPDDRFEIVRMLSHHPVPLVRLRSVVLLFWLPAILGHYSLYRARFSTDPH